MDITLDQLKQIMPNAGAHATLFLAPLNASCERYLINTPARIAAFLANVAVESGELTVKRENLCYTHATRIAAVWPHRFTIESAQDYVSDPQALADCVYAGRNGNGDCDSGDGFAYRGGTLMQLTGRANFAAAGVAVGADLEGNPELCNDPIVSADVAAWFFSSHGCNELSDEGQFDAVCKRINGGTTGLAERRTYHTRALAALTGD